MSQQVVALSFMWDQSELRPLQRYFICANVTLFKKNWRISDFFVRPLIPLISTSSDVYPGFQSQDGSFAFMLPHLCAVDSSDSPVVQHSLLASRITAKSTHTSNGGIKILDRVITNHAAKFVRPVICADS